MKILKDVHVGETATVARLHGEGPVKRRIMDMKIALAGNPNCGKTTLFNALTGSSQYVGNWPGVTVEKKVGRLKGRRDVVIQDLPGIYSLSPYTLWRRWWPGIIW